MKGLDRWGTTLLRLVLGVIFVMHGYLALYVMGPGALGQYTTRMGFPPGLAPVLAAYLIVAHLVGGACLLLGLWPRLAALAQVPIMVSVLFLYHGRQGFFLHGIVLDKTSGQAIAGGYEYALLVLAATLVLVLQGGGALAVHRS